eukprot:SM000006S19339  [mRNA]  locus=s6:170095:173516:- [translate_table: standard]
MARVALWQGPAPAPAVLLLALALAAAALSAAPGAEAKNGMGGHHKSPPPKPRPPPPPPPSSFSFPSTFHADIVVAKDGSGDFKTLTAAAQHIRSGATSISQTTIVYIKAGFYNESVIFNKTQNFVTLIGDPGRTILAYNKYSALLDAMGNPLTTSGSGSIIVLGSDFTGINLIFRNDAKRPAPNTYDRQSVALRLNGPRAMLVNCSVISFQDSLYAQNFQQYFKNCYFTGNIDFIFGGAKAYFEDCVMNISSLGYAGITAQHKVYATQDSGFVFNRGIVTGTNQGWLGRAWGKYAFTIFANMYMDNVVMADGWQDFGIHSRQLTSFYAEYNNYGIGANKEGRVAWERTLTPAQVKAWITVDFINGRSWLRPLPTLPGNVRPPWDIPNAYGKGFPSPPPLSPPPPSPFPPPPPPPPPHSPPPPPPPAPKTTSTDSLSPPPMPPPPAFVDCRYPGMTAAAKLRRCYVCCKSGHYPQLGDCFRTCMTN